MGQESRDVLAARLRAALELSEMGIAIHRAQLRREHPEATDDQIEALVLAWLHARPGDSWGRPISWPPSRS